MKGSKELVAEAKAEIENLGPAAVASELEKGAVLVDIREPGELQEKGRIAGSVHIPRGMLEFRADPDSPYHDATLARDKRVILQCASGGRSALAAKTLQEMGYSDVAHLDGGLNAWVEAGKPLA